MSVARTLTTRLPIRAVPRVATRFNSSTATTSPQATAARIAELAATAQKPSGLEASVPVMWAITGALGVVAWNRADGKKEDCVEKLLIV